jgi:hypothetical protein
MNKYAEGMNADYSKTITAVSRDRFRRVDPTSWDTIKIIVLNSSEAR